ncbi:MAG: hypothetical protein FJY99_01370 [Candidatus Sericytochromatia bacterium]|nr:hypothetical protein [Candidatus Tanganyikabacteria bacterium]
MTEVRQRQGVAAGNPKVATGVSGVASREASPPPVRDAYVPARPDAVETTVRGGAVAVGATDGALSGLGLLARFFRAAGPIAARTANIARVTARLAPVLNLPVAAYDVHKAMAASRDPRSTSEVRQSQAVMAGLSVTAAVAGVAALAFPPAAVPLVVTSVAAGVGSLVADQWPNLRRWLGR